MIMYHTQAGTAGIIVDPVFAARGGARFGDREVPEGKEAALQRKESTAVFVILKRGLLRLC